MARTVFLTLACVILAAAVCVSAVELDAPVPVGFTLPNIFNPVLDRADGREQAKTLVQLVAKEPKVAFGVGGAEKAVEDMWNREEDAESSASVAQLKMLREVTSLTKLIDQGKKILAVLPKKEARLALLKQKLSTILDAKAKREAAEKLDEQQALLAAIKKRESKMSTRLGALKQSQAKLTTSVAGLQAVIDGKPAPATASAPVVGQVAPQQSSASNLAARRPAAHALLETGNESELDMELQEEAAAAFD